MPEGTSFSTSAPVTTELTEDAAAERIASLFSDEENTQATETPSHAGNRAAPDTDVEDEPHVDDEESDTDDEADGDNAAVEGDDVDDEENDDSNAPPPKLYRVKVNGEEIEVPEDELVKGYSRTQDYTRKTQEAAELRKQAEAETAAARSEREQLAAQLTTLQQALQQMTPAEPDWDQLRAEDPEHFADVYAAWQIHQRRLSDLDAARQDAVQKVLADRHQQHMSYLQAEKAKLVEAIPEWKNPDVAKKEAAALREYAKSKGYSDDEINAVSDHRVMLLLRNAMRYERAEANRPALRQKVEKVRAATPGTKDTGRKAVTDVTRQRQRLSKTHSVQDAAALIEMLDNN